EGVFYVFDCLSDLLDAWATDTMIGNFFAVTCPYLFDLQTVAYFALLRGSHSFATVARIRATTQLLLDLYGCDGSLFLHPLKVWQRSSATMFLPHRKEGNEFIPLTTSREATQLYARLVAGSLPGPERHLDSWHRLFLRAGRLAREEGAEAERQAMVEQLCRIIIGRDERMLALARRHLTLDDLLQIRSRLIGTGFIGGKATGMLLARHILRNDPARDWEDLLEPHDSFYVGSDLFGTFIVHNGWWQLYMQQKSEAGYFRAAAELRERILTGEFPPEVREEFRKMLEYFGQYPVIVRSSSLLEDSFGNAFAGKYDSYFCVNQGSPDERYSAFEEAVRRIFASTLSDEALAYRQSRGLSGRDEQMALLVQRVSGAYHGRYFFPDLAGVGVSYNTFVWDPQLDPRAGMLRLVVGLGTRAVDRTEGDYARLVALDRPELLPHGNDSDPGRYSQREADLLDVTTNSLRSVPLSRLIAEGVGLPLPLLARHDRETEARLAERGRKGEEVWAFTLEGLLGTTEFPRIMQRLLKTLEQSYDYPVDVEFTVNFTPDLSFSLNVVQCRPLQTRGVDGHRVAMPAEIAAERLLFRSRGSFMGGNAVRRLRRLVMVDAAAYSTLELSARYDVARIIGRLNRQTGDRDSLPALLLGPGRWGTSTPSLGVPVRFAEINHFTAIVEVAFPIGGLLPDLSFGS
ncbi:MAG TPA: PEP/pyruvate-binding domain-containing protein, partial [Geobacteraceae bacterium]